MQFPRTDKRKLFMLQSWVWSMYLNIKGNTQLNCYVEIINVPSVCNYDNESTMETIGWLLWWKHNMMKTLLMKTVNDQCWGSQLPFLNNRVLDQIDYNVEIILSPLVPPSQVTSYCSKKDSPSNRAWSSEHGWGYGQISNCQVLTSSQNEWW